MLYVVHKAKVLFSVSHAYGVPEYFLRSERNYYGRNFTSAASCVSFQEVRL